MHAASCRGENRHPSHSGSRHCITQPAMQAQRARSPPLPPPPLPRRRPFGLARHVLHAHQITTLDLCARRRPDAAPMLKLRCASACVRLRIRHRRRRCRRCWSAAAPDVGWLLSGRAPGRASGRRACCARITYAVWRHRTRGGARTRVSEVTRLYRAPRAHVTLLQG
jgi:hypothetical protein